MPSLEINSDPSDSAALKLGGETLEQRIDLEGCEGYLTSMRNEQSNHEIDASGAKRDDAALAAVLVKLTPLIVAVITRRFECLRPMVEDIVAEACMKAWIHREKLRTYSDCDVRPWLCTIATNLAKDQIKKQSEGHSNLSTDVSDHRELESWVQVSKADDIDRLHKCLDEESEKFRKIVLLKFEGLKDREIAERLSIPIGSVFSGYSRGCERLKQCMLRMDNKSKGESSCS